MRRVPFLLFALLIAIAGSLAPSAARQATPAAAGPGVGTPVVVIGADGTEIARVTVEELADPFEQYDPGSPPQRGYHFALVTITIANTGVRPLEVDPGDVYLVDGDGFVYGRGGVYLPSEGPTQELQYQGDLAPGAEASGAVGFQILNGVDLARVVYVPQSDRLISLVDLRPAAPAIGETVPLVGTDGTEIGQMTVGELIDPFAAYDPGSPPLRGYHYVLLTITVANTGARPLEVDPSDFYLVDSDGFRYGRTSVYRGDAPPVDLDYQGELAPGAEAAGAIGFQVLNGATIASVIHIPQSGRLVTIAEVGAVPGPGTPDGAVTPTVIVSPTAVAADACLGLTDWWAATSQRFQRASQLINALGDLQAATAADLPQIRQAAADFAALAEEQRAGQTPAAAQTLNDLFVQFLTMQSQGLDFFADGLEAADVAQQVVALANLGEAYQLFDEGGEIERTAIEAASICPELNELIG